MIDPFFGILIDWPLIKDVLLLPTLIMGISITIGFFINRFLKRYVDTHIELQPDSFLKIFLQSLKGLPRLWCFGIGVYWTIHALALPDTITQLLSYILFAIIVFSITRVLARVAEVAVKQHTAAVTSTNDSTSTLLSNLVTLTIYAFGAVIILGYLGISIAPILTALGVGGMAMALGLQDSLASLFAGLHLIMSKQIRIGDHISLSSGDTGEVVDITWRYTTLQTITNNTIIVPNKNIAAATLTNYDKPSPHLSVSVTVGVSYDSDLETVEQVTLAVAKKAMRAVVDNYQEGELPEPSVRFHTFGDSSINFDVILHAKRLGNQALLKHYFIKELTKTYREKNIEIPYPIRTIIQSK